MATKTSNMGNTTVDVQPNGWNTCLLACISANHGGVESLQFFSLQLKFKFYVVTRLCLCSGEG